jgi:HPt (histidine-containing phosphotransfer) domain-containing protein
MWSRSARDARAPSPQPHELKGSAGNFGAAEVARTAERLEMMGGASDLTGLDGAFAEFERAMTSLTTRLAAVATEAPE